MQRQYACNIEARSHKEFFRGKAVSTTYSVCVFVYILYYSV